MLEIVDTVLEIMTFANKSVLICRFYVHSLVFCSLYMNMNHDSLNRTLHMGKRLEKKAKVNFKIYDVITSETNNCSTRIAQYLKK